MQVRAKSADYSEITPDSAEFRVLLGEAGLPTEDLAGRHKHYWGRFSEDGRLVAAGGFEIHGKCGILRSCVVAPQMRSSGVGAALVEFLIEKARASGICELYLLTEGAAAWFERFGFVRIDRASVPHDIAAVPQFASICPDTAVAMRRSDGDLARGGDPESG